MEIYMVILSIILWIIGVFFLLAFVGAILEGSVSEIFFLLIIGIIACNAGRLAHKHRNDFNKKVIYTKPIYRYKVKELEKNTVFNISDSIGGFKPKDTVWVNYKKMMVDPLDSIAMQCVIIEEINN